MAIMGMTWEGWRAGSAGRLAADEWQEWYGAGRDYPLTPGQQDRLAALWLERRIPWHMDGNEPTQDFEASRLAHRDLADAFAWEMGDAALWTPIFALIEEWDRAALQEAIIEDQCRRDPEAAEFWSGWVKIEPLIISAN